MNSRDLEERMFSNSSGITAHPEVARARRSGTPMILPGNGSGLYGDATMPRVYPGARRDDGRSAAASLLPSSKNSHQIERPSCLKNLCPQGGILNDGEPPLSPFHDEPTQNNESEKRSFDYEVSRIVKITLPITRLAPNIVRSVIGSAAIQWRCRTESRH